MFCQTYQSELFLHRTYVFVRCDHAGDWTDYVRRERKGGGGIMWHKVAYQEISQKAEILTCYLVTQDVGM